jgi:hypothetical protein
MRHEEGVTSRRSKHRNNPRRTHAISIGFHRSPGARPAGQGIERAPVGGERLGIEAEAERRGWRGRKGDVSRP